MDKLTDIDLLEQYLRKELSLAEVSILEKRLKIEPLLVKQLAELRELEDGIRYARLKEVLDDIALWEVDTSIRGVEESKFEKEVSEMIRLEKHKELFSEIQGFEEDDKNEFVEEKSVSRQIGQYWWGVAAGILLLIGAVLYLYQPAEELTNEELFAMYFEPYPANMVKRGGDVDSLMMGYLAYESGDYKKAIDIFEVQGDTIAQFFLGVSYLADKRPEKAIGTLESFKLKSTILENQADWFILLSQIILKDDSKILLKLEEKSLINSYNQERYKELYEIIKERN